MKQRRLYYGWVVVAVAFITMAISVNSRSMFSLLFPPILNEMGWERSTTAGAFSVGFLTSVFVAPLVGWGIDRLGARFVLPVAATLVAVGLVWTTAVSEPWHLYFCFGVMVVGASITISYMGHGAFLPNWFVRRRGLALGIAYSGVGFGSILLFPWLQTLIDGPGWRQACIAFALLLVAVVVPLNLLAQRTRPEEMGRTMDDAPRHPARTGAPALRPPDPPGPGYEGASDWTLRTAIRTARFWWVFGGTALILFVWYAIQIHQTRYLLDVGFTSKEAAWALGLIPFCGLAGQLAIGHLSDRVSREWAWTLCCAGFALCYAAFLLMPGNPARWLLYVVIGAQGLLAYGLPVLISAVPADLFGGRNFGAIFGALSVSAALGPSAGPFVTGLLYDASGSYDAAFGLGIAFCFASIGCIWLAAPRRHRTWRG